MTSKLSKTLDRITWRHWLIFLILSQAIYAIMLTQTFPYIRKEAGGIQAFDLLPFGYTYPYAHTFLSRLSLSGYHTYQFIQLPLDLFYPFLTAALGICTLTLLRGLQIIVQGNTVQKKYGAVFIMALSLPICAMSFDYLENIMIWVMLALSTQTPSIIVSIASTFTIIKSLSTTLFYTLVLIFCIMIGVSFLRAKLSVRNNGKF
jgi:hypothetical protein